MEFRIADTFTDSLARLSGEEQKAVKMAAFDLQLNAAHPSLQFHKLDRAKDRRFWSIRAGSDIRLIVHRTENSLLLCYAAHHDKAYEWAERRKLETHPKTGAAQLVEVRETVREVAIPRYVDAAQLASARTSLKPPLFAGVSEEQLLAYGVPPEWLSEVRRADEDSILELAGRLPAEAAEALLDLAIGVEPKIAPAAAPGADPFAHPDALRRFRVMTGAEELERALNWPWDKWSVFLHPAQRAIVERDFNGPARVSGSAGTGKTIVAVHRAVFLARCNPEARVLLATFSATLANALADKLRRLIDNEPRLAERLEVHSMDAIGRRLYERNGGRSKPAYEGAVRDILRQSAEGSPFSARFVFAEWQQVVDAWQLETWEAYRDVPRLGRKTRLKEPQRAALWAIFERARATLASRGLVTAAGMFTRAALEIAWRPNLPFDYVVIDEAQDVGVAQLRFLASLAGSRPNGLFFAGDLGQRIFQQPFSWKALGVDVRGRSSTLRINYRTSHQIRSQADRLLGPEVADVDGNAESRKGTISTFNGPAPEVRVLPSREEEIRVAAEWLKSVADAGVAPHETGVFVRSEAEMARARAAVEAAGLRYRLLDERIETGAGKASIGSMHLAKGLEFRAVAVMACDDEVIPSQERMESAGDDSDLDEVYATERHLLYVACTRARDHLLVTATDPPSEFLADMAK